MAIQTKLKDLRPARDRYQRQVKLLSGGFINGEAFPDGQITVFPWDNSVDEWISAKVRKGSVKGRNILFNVLPRVCNLNGCRLEDFVSSEVLLVLMVARSILRNDQVNYNPECTFCGASSQARVKIPDQLEKVGEKVAGWPGYDLITLPECQDVVKVRPVTVGEELAIIGRPEVDRNEVCNDSIARLVSGLLDVNGGAPDNAKEAITWAQALPPGDLEYLLIEFDKVQPQLSTTIHHKCDECGKAFDYELTLDEDFFRRVGQASDRGKVADSVQPGVPVKGSSVGPNQGAGAAHPQAPRVARATR